MKNYLTLLVLFSLLTACQSNTDNNTTETTTKEENSTYYNETVNTSSGKFLGYTLGESYAQCLEKINKDDIFVQEKDFIAYKKNSAYTVAEYSLGFENDKLTEINFDSHIYNEVGDPNAEGARNLFEELRTDFEAIVGNKPIDSYQGNNIILHWNKEGIDVQLIAEEEQVHAYIFTSISKAK